MPNHTDDPTCEGLLVQAPYLPLAYTQGVLHPHRDPLEACSHAYVSAYPT